MRQLKVKLTIHPPVNVLIQVRPVLVKAGRTTARFMSGVASLDAGRLPAHDTQPVEMTTTTSLGSSIFAAARGSAISSYLLSERCSYQGEGLRAQVRTGKPPAPGRMGTPSR